jgi:hypothetical protein
MTAFTKNKGRQQNKKVKHIRKYCRRYIQEKWWENIEIREVRRKIT